LESSDSELDNCSLSSINTSSASSTQNITIDTDKLIKISCIKIEKLMIMKNKIRMELNLMTSTIGYLHVFDFTNVIEKDLENLK